MGDNLDRIGNVIVGSTLIVLGAAYVAGTLGVAFIGELAVVALAVAGILMIRGSFGDHGGFGWMLALVAPAAWIVPLFVAALLLVTPIVGAGIIVLGIARLAGLW